MGLPQNVIAAYTKKSHKIRNPEPFLSRFSSEKVPGFMHYFFFREPSSSFPQVSYFALKT